MRMGHKYPNQHIVVLVVPIKYQYLLPSCHQFGFFIHLLCDAGAAWFHLQGTCWAPSSCCGSSRHEMGKQFCLLQQEVEAVAAIFLLKHKKNTQIWYYMLASNWISMSHQPHRHAHFRTSPHVNPQNQSLHKHKMMILKRPNSWTHLQSWMQSLTIYHIHITHTHKIHINKACLQHQMQTDFIFYFFIIFCNIKT